MASKRRIESRFKQNSCTRKRKYSDSDEAARVAGYEANKDKVHLKIYKCPYGDHWHIAKWRSK